MGQKEKSGYPYVRFRHKVVDMVKRVSACPNEFLELLCTIGAKKLHRPKKKSCRCFDFYLLVDEVAIISSIPLRAVVCLLATSWT